MRTKQELIKEVEEEARKQIGIRFKVNPLNGFRGYRSRSKSELEGILNFIKG